MTDAPSEALLPGLLDQAGVGVALLDAGLRYHYVNAQLAEVNGVPAADHVGRTIRDVLPDVADRLEELVGRVLETGRPVLRAVVTSHLGTEERHWQVSYLPLDTPAGRMVGAVVVDVTEREAATAEARRRVAQQELVADLGRRALRVGAIEDLLDLTAGRIREALGADFSGIMFPDPSGERLVMRAGAGFPPDAMGRVGAPFGTGSQAGYSYDADGPVLMRDAAVEERFDVSELMENQGIVSAISTAIPGDDGPVGVLGVLSRTRGSFDEDDSAFVSSVAHVVGEALRADDQRRRLEELAAQRGRLVAQALEAGEREQRRIADVLHDDVLQHLLSARLELSGGGDVSIERVHAAVSAAADLVRSVTSSIHPVTLTHAGLQAAVERVAADHGARGGLDIAVEVDPAARGPAERLLVSLVRELLANVVKHAAAKRALVSIAEEAPGSVRLRVADDGCGIDEEAVAEAVVAGSLGLAYARERVEALGGSLGLGTGLDGRGTAVTVTLPVTAPTA